MSTPETPDKSAEEVRPAIHGIISRQQMYDRWTSYGERLVPDGTFDVQAISPVETMHIILGGGPKLTASIMELAEARNEPFQDLMYDASLGKMDPQDHGLDSKFWDSIHRSHQAQQRNAKAARAEYSETWPIIVRKTARAAIELTKEDVFSNEQAKRFQSWLLQPDGTPRVQYTPLSRLEYMRFRQGFHGVLPDTEGTAVVGNDETNFSLGVIISAHALHPYSQSLRGHNRIHELVRASLSGLEVYDVTRDDGKRLPLATIVGVEVEEPRTRLEPKPYLSGRNGRIAAGMAEFITKKLLEIDPSLGVPLPDVRGSGDWAVKIAAIKGEHPLVYKAMIDAWLQDAASVQDKRRAIAVMHERANRQLGTRDALDRIFNGQGRVYHALHTSRL